MHAIDIVLTPVVFFSAALLGLFAVGALIGLFGVICDAPSLASGLARAKAAAMRSIANVQPSRTPEVLAAEAGVELAYATR